MNMHLSKAQVLPEAVFNTFHDGRVVFTASHTARGTHLTAFEPNSLAPLVRLRLEKIPVRPDFVASEDRVFYISSGGLIGVDSYSGEPLTAVDTGAGIPMLFEIMGDRIYALCGVPLMNGMRYGFESFCLVVCDLETGSKISQSQTVTGQYSSLRCHNDQVYMTVGDYLHCFSQTGELLGSTTVKVKSKFPIVFSDRVVVLATDSGLMETVALSGLLPERRMVYGRSRTPPVALGDRIAWCCEDGVYIAKSCASECYRVDAEVANAVVVYEDSVFWTDASGKVSGMNTSNRHVESIILHDKGINRIMQFGGNLYVFSESHLFKIGV